MSTDKMVPLIEYRSMETAPRDGSAFLAYGQHADPLPAELAHVAGLAPGDHWWGILLWDVFRDDRDPAWVFAKDGAPAWSAPLAWATLTVPRMDTEEAHFDMIDVEGGVQMVALETWKRDSHATYLRLMLVSADVDEATVAGWTDEQCKAADVWACSTHLSASDHDDIVVPERPAFVPLLPPGGLAGRHPITGEIEA